MRAILSLMALALLAGFSLPAQEPPPQPDRSSDDKPQLEDSATNQPPATGEVEAESSGTKRQAVVSIGSSAELKADESAEAVVVIGGDARVHGKVREAVVAIGGTAEVDGEVGDAVVAVFGGVHLKAGARVAGDVVSVGGKVTVDPEAKVSGHVQEVGFGFLGRMEWLTHWFKECVLKLRPLAPGVGWIWMIALGFFLFYLLIAAVLPRPVEACVNQLENRPATTFFLGLLTQILAPIIFAILTATGVGLIVVPFIGAALLAGCIIGKIALIEWIGFGLSRRFGQRSWQNPVAAFVVGSVIITLLYNIWVVGLITYALLSIWGIGVAVGSVFGGLRREVPAAPASPTPSPSLPLVPTPEPALATAGAGQGTDPLTSTVAPEPFGSPAPQPLPPAVPESLVHPRAGFWERMGAAFLDVVLVSILGAAVGGPPQAFLIMLAYFAGMWTWKGTTIGGIVLGLKVVRPDGHPISFPVALVRGLAAAFSVVVLFLGFLWIAWDKERQGWHDKIAGTVVLKLPRGTPLICL